MMPMGRYARLIAGFFFAGLAGMSHVERGWGIERVPDENQVKLAVEQGLQAARERIPPNRLYSWFGSNREFEPKGFLMTKMNGITVLASHFGLRGERPSDQDIQRILDEELMLVSVTLFGETSSFAKDGYVVLEQGTRLIKPINVRVDGVANRSSRWPDSPAFQAKIIGTFPYAGFDPLAPTTIIVFPRAGGKISFDVDFSKIP